MGVGDRESQPMCTKFLFGVVKRLWNQIAVIIVQLCEYTQSNWLVYLNVMTDELYLYKAFMFFFFLKDHSGWWWGQSGSREARSAITGSKVAVAKYPWTPCMGQPCSGRPFSSVPGFLNSAPLTFWTGKFSVVGAVLCVVGYLAASSPSTH